MSMSVEAVITVTLAEVEVTDEYRVGLRTRRKLTDLAPDEAVQLANELIMAATRAVEAWHDDLAAAGVVRPRVVHGFDVDHDFSKEAGS